jgi:hypothetical protein
MCERVVGGARGALHVVQPREDNLKATRRVFHQAFQTLAAWEGFVVFSLFSVFFKEGVRFVKQEKEPPIWAGIKPFLDVPKKCFLAGGGTDLVFAEHADLLEPRHEHAPEGVNAATTAEEFALEVNENSRSTSFEIVESASERTEQSRFAKLTATVDKARSPWVGERFQFTTSTEEHLGRHLAGGDAVRFDTRKRQRAAEKSGEARSGLGAGECK